MEGRIRDIPGYYYDREKKKYFKISNQAPASSAYSSRDVKKRKVQNEKSEALSQSITRQKGRIQRAQFDPLTTGLLGANLGHDTLDIPQVFAGGLEETGRFKVSDRLPNRPVSLFAINHRPDLGSSIVEIHSVYEDEYLSIRANADKHKYSHYSLEWPKTLRRGVFGNPGTATSLSINNSCARLAMTWLSGSAHSGIAVVPTNDDEEESANMILGPGVSRGSDVSVYTSASAPAESNIAFAFGSSHGIMTMDKRHSNMRFMSPNPVLHDASPRDIFALEFLHDNHHVLLSGGRNGVLNIIDLRIPRFGADTDTIIHPSSIAHIKQLDAHRILVSGLNSSLLQYDLRFRKTKAPSSQPPQPRLKSFSNFAATSPILYYPRYHNSATLDLGLDVDVEVGIIAAVREPSYYDDNEDSHIQLFSLFGGHKLNSSVEALWIDKRFSHSKCVKFARDVVNQTKSLYVMPFDLHRYSFTSPDDDF